MLTKDVKDVGQAGEVKEVADGFGRNFLIPRKGVEEEARRVRAATAKREAKDIDEARELAEEIGNKTVVVRLRVGEEGKAFGAITNADIAEALRAQHKVEVDRHRIDLKEPIKTLGEHQVSLHLHRDVEATINVVVTQDR